MIYLHFGLCARQRLQISHPHFLQKRDPTSLESIILLQLMQTDIYQFLLQESQTYQYPVSLKLGLGGILVSFLQKGQ